MSTVFGPYLQVLRHPGAARFSAAGLLARLQLSMTGLGAVMLLSVERGSYAVAGTVSAIYALSAAALGPQLSRLIDIHGQRRVVPWQLAAHIPAVLLMVFFAVFTPLTWPILGLAFIAGAAQPSIGSLVRTRWSTLLTGSPQLRTAFTWESLLDEVVFIVGPPVATIVSLQVFPAAAMLLGLLLLTSGTLLLLTQRRSEPVPSGRARAKGGRPAIALPGVAGVAAIFMLLGGIFGSFEVTTVAFARQAGVGSIAGLLLALYAAGSLLGGLVFGMLRLRASLLRQFVLGTLALSVVTLPMPFLGTVWLVGAGLFVAGLACSPVLITGTALIEKIVPSHRLTEAITWTSSGMAVGISVAVPLAGVVIDHAGASTSYWVTSGSALACAAIALLVLGSLKRAQAAADRAVPSVPAGAALPNPEQARHVEFGELVPVAADVPTALAVGNVTAGPFSDPERSTREAVPAARS